MVATGSALLRDAVSGYGRLAGCSPQLRPSSATRAASCTNLPVRRRSRPPHLAARLSVSCTSTASQLQSETELFLDKLEKDALTELPSGSDLKAELQQLESQVTLNQTQHPSCLPADLLITVAYDECRRKRCNSALMGCIKVPLHTSKKMRVASTVNQLQARKQPVVLQKRHLEG